jgi:hypothetical protein
MIENATQHDVTQEQLQRFEAALSEAETKLMLMRAQRDALRSVVLELRELIIDYDLKQRGTTP